jgi:hypothetical protein
MRDGEHGAPRDAKHRRIRAFAHLRSVRLDGGHWPLHCHAPRMRGIQYAEAHRLKHSRLWNTGSPAFAGDDSGD